MHASESPLALKLKAEVTRSPKQRKLVVPQKEMNVTRNIAPTSSPTFHVHQQKMPHVSFFNLDRH